MVVSRRGILISGLAVMAAEFGRVWCFEPKPVIQTAFLSLPYAMTRQQFMDSRSQWLDSYKTDLIVGEFIAKGWITHQELQFEGKTVRWTISFKSMREFKAFEVATVGCFKEEERLAHNFPRTLHITHGGKVLRSDFDRKTC